MESSDTQANIENVENSAENSGTSKRSEFTTIDGSSQQEYDAISEADGEERRGVGPKVKVEPIDELIDDCVILAVNPKSTIEPEIIDLEPPSEDSNQTRAEMPSENIENVIGLSEFDEKCDSLLGDNRSSTPCNKKSSEISVQLCDFIVLSETNDDSFIDADSTNSRTSVTSSELDSSRERLIEDAAVETSSYQAP